MRLAIIAFYILFICGCVTPRGTPTSAEVTADMQLQMEIMTNPSNKNLTTSQIIERFVLRRAKNCSFIMIVHPDVTLNQALRFCRCANQAAATGISNDDLMALEGSISLKNEATRKQLAEKFKAAQPQCLKEASIILSN